MKKLFIKTFTLSIMLWQFLVSGNVLAEEDSNNLADIWVMTSIQGKSADFERAFVEHVKFLKSKGDPREWKAYTPVLSDGFNKYIVRYCCTNYPDMDTYQKWQNDNKITEHWNSTAGKYVGAYEHYLGEVDLDNSNWNVEGKNNQFFAVTEYHTKMGMGKSVEEGKKMLSDNAKAMKWPYSWSWQRQIGGNGNLSIVVPYENFSQMAPPEKSFAKALAEHIGDEAKASEMFSKWSDNFSHTTYSVWRIRPDLMVQQKQ